MPTNTRKINFIFAWFKPNLQAVIMILVLTILCFATLLVNNHYSNAKIFEIEILLGLICICFAVAFYFRLKIHLSPIDIPVSLYLLVLPLYQSIFLVIPFTQILTQVFCWQIYFLVKLLVTNSESKALSTLIPAVKIIIILQFLISFNKIVSKHFTLNSFLEITGGFNNSGPFAIFLTALVSMVFADFLQRDNLSLTWKLMSPSLPILVPVCAVIMSGSRSSWIGFVVALIFVTSILLKDKLLPIKRRYGYIFFILAVVVIFPLLWLLFQYKPGSSQGRLLIWMSTLLLIKEHWFQGVGLGNFDFFYAHYQTKFFALNNLKVDEYGLLAGDVRYAFNIFLQTFSEYGIFGLLFFLVIIAAAVSTLSRIFTIKKDKRAVSLTLVTPVIVILVAGLTAYPLSTLPIAMFFWMLVAFLSVLDPLAVSVNRDSVKIVLLQTSVTFFFLGLTILGVYFISFGRNHFLAHQKFERLKQIYVPRKDTQALLNLSRYLRNNEEFLFYLANNNIDNEKFGDALKYLSLAKKLVSDKEFYYSAGKCYERLGLYDKAYHEYEVVRRYIPNLIKPYYLQANIYYSATDRKKFIVLANRALSFNPKINSRETRQMKAELSQKLKLIGYRDQ